MNILYKKIAYNIIFKPIQNEDTQPRDPLWSIENLSPELKEKIKEVENWSKLAKKVNSIEYSARMMLTSLVCNRIPLFSSQTRHFVQQIVDILTSPFNRSGIGLITECFLKLYHCLRRTMRAFNLFSRIWRINRTPVRQKTDLYMNELDPTHPNTFQLVQPNGIYYFALNNLTRIIVDSITNQNGMFVEPLIAKNPYTNTPLTKTEIFNVYFALRHKGTKIPEFLQKFYDCELNIYEFRVRHETELRNYGVKQYVKNAPTSELYNDLCDMLEVNKMKNKICVDPTFSKKEFVNAMMPYLEMFFLGRYSFSSTTRLYETKKLKMHLKKFAEKNPIYGKQMRATKKNTKNNETIHYYSKVNSTFGYSSTCYMQTHIYNDEETFERYVDNGDVIETYNANFLLDSPLRMPFITRSSVEIQAPTRNIPITQSEEDEEDEEEEDEYDIDTVSTDDEEIIGAQSEPSPSEPSPNEPAPSESEYQYQYDEEENDDGSIS